MRTRDGGVEGSSGDPEEVQANAHHDGPAHLLQLAGPAAERVQAEADIVILLSNAGEEANKAIASQVPGIDIIISGGSEEVFQPVRPAGGALVVQADVAFPGDAGRRLGWLEASLDPSGALTGHTWRSVELDPSITDDPTMAAWAAGLERR